MPDSYMKVRQEATSSSQFARNTLLPAYPHLLDDEPLSKPAASPPEPTRGKAFSIAAGKPRD